MIEVNIHEAKARLSSLVRQAKAGQTVILCERNRPVAEIRRLRPGGKPGERRLGLMPGSAGMGEGFFREDATIAAEFEKAVSPGRKSR
jgi:antitoxin (DNA-binding transcriptional repressor) of toxin-antitoxin stability system